MILGWYSNHYRKTKKYSKENDFYLFGALIFLALMFLFPDASQGMQEQPKHYLQSALGGVLIGSSVILYLKLLGKILGLSGIFGNLFSPTGTEKDMKMIFSGGFLFLISFFLLFFILLDLFLVPFF